MTTPFWPSTVPYAGATPDDLIPWDTYGSGRIWLGNPGNMIELPSPQSLSAPQSRFEVAHGLYGGGTAVTYYADAVRSWPLSWATLGPRDWQILAGFHGRAFGADPWCLVTPDGRNRLTRRQSMCGAVADTVEGWDAASGTLAYDSTDTAPIAPGGVMKWSGLSAASNLAPCADAATLVPDTQYGTPYVPAEPFLFSVYMKASSGAPVVALELVGVHADGSSSVTVAASSVTLGSSWQQYTVIASPGDLGSSPYVVPVIAYQSGGSALLAANPLTGYFSEAVDWAAGSGVPRVVLAAGLTRDMTPAGSGAATLTLSEAYPGAA